MSTGNNAEDRHLVERTLSGDRAAYGELIYRYQDRIYRFSLRLTRCSQEAEDLTQETFMRAWRYLHNYKPGYRFVTWLYAIANNLHLDRLKKRGRLKTVSLDKEHDNRDPLLTMMESPNPGPEEETLNNLVNEEIREVIDSLPDLYRNILILRFVELLSYEEIGEALEIPAGTVKTRIFRARNMLWSSLIASKGEAFEAMDTTAGRQIKDR